MSFDQIHVLMFYMLIEYRYLLYALQWVKRFISGIKIDIFTVPNSENNILIFFTVPFFGATFCYT